MDDHSNSDLVGHLLRSLRDKPDEFNGESIDVPLRLTADHPVKVVRIPTFDLTVSRPVTPMLKDRYSFASTCQFGCDTWLSPDGMLTWMGHPEVQQYHSSLRQHWTDSAPMLFPDNKLSLFGITEEVPDSLIYLVWSTDGEPEVWTYLGTEQNRFHTLANYLRWCVG